MGLHNLDSHAQSNSTEEGKLVLLSYIKLKLEITDYKWNDNLLQAADSRPSHFFLVKGVKGPSLYLTECMSKMTTLCDNVTNVYAKCRM